MIQLRATRRLGLVAFSVIDRHLGYLVIDRNEVSRYAAVFDANCSYLVRLILDG
jgi:hypothetical protein